MLWHVLGQTPTAQWAQQADAQFLRSISWQGLSGFPFASELLGSRCWFLPWRAPVTGGLGPCRAAFLTWVLPCLSSGCSQGPCTGRQKLLLSPVG